jgi:hypothetical protein
MHRTNRFRPGAWKSKITNIETALEAVMELEMEDRWISDLTVRALNWGAWAVVVLSALGSVTPW